MSDINLDFYNLTSYLYFFIVTSRKPSVKSTLSYIDAFIESTREFNRSILNLSATYLLLILSNPVSKGFAYNYIEVKRITKNNLIFIIIVKKII